MAAKKIGGYENTGTRDMGPKARSGREGVPDAEYDLRILQSLRRIMRAVDIYSRKLSLNYSITAPQLVCLLTVKEKGPMTSASIAGEMHVSPSTLVGILDRLEAKGLVRRDRATDDRRRVFITVTGKGRRLADKAPSPLQDTLVEGLAGLSERELKTIARSLEKIVELMEAEGVRVAPILDAAPIDHDKPEPSGGRGRH